MPPTREVWHRGTECTAVTYRGKHPALVRLTPDRSLAGVTCSEETAQAGEGSRGARVAFSRCSEEASPSRDLKEVRAHRAAGEQAWEAAAWL